MNKNSAFLYFISLITALREKKFQNKIYFPVMGYLGMIPGVYSVVFLFFAWGCAQQVGPTGGPKDSTPPQIVESSPENFSTGFNGNKIVLHFDEFVQLKDLQSKLIISPPLKQIPELKIKGKSLEISFEDTLYPNTTYNFQFGDGIVDNNEGNPLDSNLFVFSTGNSIDSLTWKGKVKNAFNLVPEKQVLVMLYDQFSDSLPYEKRPVYFSKTAEDGSFELKYLREGKFKAFAIKDGNGNYLYDMPDEDIAFVDEPVTAGDTSEANIFLFREELASQFFKRGYAENYRKLVFVFSKETHNPRAIPLNRDLPKGWYLEEFSEKRDSVFFWLTGIAQVDTLQMQIWDDNIILDTVEIVVPSKEVKIIRSKDSAIPEKLILKSNVSASAGQDLFTNLSIETSRPVKSYDVSKIIFSDQKDTLDVKFIQVDSAKRKFEIAVTWKENTDYSVFIPPGTFEDFFDLKNDTFSLSFKTRKKADYGTITVKLGFKPSQGQFLLQLMDGKDNIIRQIATDGNSPVLLKDVLASQYKLKLIADGNTNGKWDTGNYLKKIQPEKVLFYPSTVDLRPKFDLELDWKENVK